MFVKELARRWSREICAILAALSTIAFADAANAQSQLLSSDLLQQLQNIQVGQQGGTMTAPSPLDTLRQQAGQNGQQNLQTLANQQSANQLNQLNLVPSALENDYRSRMFDAFAEQRRQQQELLRQQGIQQPAPDALQQQGGTAQGQQTPEQMEQAKAKAAGIDLIPDPRQNLRQYGYDIFSRAVMPTELTVGRAPDDYVLGVGDQLVVSMHGSTERSLITSIDREGRLIVPDLPPIDAAGRTFGEVASDLRQRTQAALLGTEAYLSLGAVRTISVYVLGEVNNPGVERVTSLSSVIEALSLAGGVKKTGSLRAIQVVRGKEAHRIDLYDVLLGRPGQNLTLRDGDQIVVPPIGRTFAVTGEVNRPGIFELPAGVEQMNVRQALALAGGTLRPRGYSYRANHIADDGTQLIETVNYANGVVRDGDLLDATLIRNIAVGSIRVLGNVTVPGYVSLQSAPTAADLVRNANFFKSDPYLAFAVLERTDPVTRARHFIGVDLAKVLGGQGNFKFEDADWLYVFSIDDIRFLSSPLLQYVLVNGQLPGVDNATTLAANDNGTQAQSASSAGQAAAQAAEQQRAIQEAQLRAQQSRQALDACLGLQRVARIVSDTQSERFAAAVANIIGQDTRSFQRVDPCPQIYNIDGDVLPFLLENVVAVRGAVRRPGIYPVTAGTALSSIVSVAGGLMDTADLTSVELLKFSVDGKEGKSRIDQETISLASVNANQVPVAPGSALRFNQVPSQQERGGVLLTGEFVRPGFYAIRRGETLSQVIARAGGVTPQAYPYGAVFTRLSAKEAQQEGFARASRELNSALTLAALRANADASGLAAIRSVATELGTVEAAGRIVVEADPAVLTARPQLDVTLEPGDRLNIPKRPSTVTVVGDVLNPGTLQFIPGKAVDSYIKEAGGYQQTADEGRVFIVYPNGEATPVSRGFLGFSGSQSIPPGTTVVIPKDLTPFDWLGLTRDLTQILSQVAISAAALSAISN